PQRVGFYKITADRIIIDWQNGTHTEWSYEKENGKISAIDGGIVTEPEALPAGYKIEGKYEGGTILPNVANNQQFFFNKDGTFILNSTGFIDVPSV
ncbi:hypothetical protein VQ049_13095, partial [Staphylococcus arlettae]|uniref:hypothetical protein n=1 Tax=Staphylococcus arlettae TaxID=29378 RepID=UPI003CF40AF2